MSRIAVLICIAVLLCGCSQAVIVEQPKSLWAPTPSGQLRAGAVEVDITPLPGYPIYGHSKNGASAADGYWLRLKARIIALEDASGARVALVQLDLGASSALLHRTLAAELAGEGITPANLMMAVTHTHGGPGGFFGHKFYNTWVAASVGYDRRLVRQLTDPIVKGVKQAFRELAPARLAAAQVRVDEAAASNRSWMAWVENFSQKGEKRDVDPVHRTLTLLRVDRLAAQGVTPLAAWAVYGVHGNCVWPGYKLYHGDVQGAAARYLRERVAQKYGTHGFVAAMANGAEGDVTPGKGGGTERRCATDVGKLVADAAYRAYESLDLIMMDPPDPAPQLRVAYAEIEMAGANTAEGRLCATASVGKPQIAGSEEGRSPFFEGNGIEEGEKGPRRGCDGRKVPFFGISQSILFSADDFPTMVPFQVIYLGRALALAGFPGEPTTEVGRDVTRRVQAISRRPTAVVGLANGYATFFTSPIEYDEQHYEGGATLYGRYQGVFAAEQLERLALQLEKTSSHARFYRSRTFEPGSEACFVGNDERCDPSTWQARELELDGVKLMFKWRGIDDDEHCELPRVSIVCGDEPLRVGDQVQNDDGFAFEVTQDGNVWVAAWTIAGESAAPCHFEVKGADGVGHIRSARFRFRSAAHGHAPTVKFIAD